MRRPNRISRLIATLGLSLPQAVLALGSEVVAPTVEVIGISPVPGLDIPRNDIPSPVQSLGTRVLENNRAQTLPELFNSQLNGVSANAITGNPYQIDVNYRGFTASPLLGTPQGLSVYQDGVRINEPFGDVVHWDLIPRAAIASIDLIPGSNPLFGLNTLGGALSITTKNGLTHTGTKMEAGLGSHGRREVEVEAGRKFGDIGLYVTGSAFREDGWRNHSPSSVKQAFAKLSQRRDALEWDLSYTGARTDLIGNGLLPDSMLERDRSSIFTLPDRSRSQLDMLNLTGSAWIDEGTRLTGLFYHRSQQTRSLNGDINDEFRGDPALDGAAGANGGLGFDSETGTNNRNRLNQRAWGGALQWSRSGERHTLALGGTLDRSRSSFSQTSQIGVFDASRAVVPTEDAQIENSVDGQTRSWSLFASDTWKPFDKLAITGSLRFNRTHVITSDKLNRNPPNLDGDYHYEKLNPALGTAWTVTPGLTLYANATQGNRAPTPIELGCADPANPCTLPNAMQADPYLKQVVTRTLEVGARGTANGLGWNATLFRANNRDDILFVGTSTSAGYFTNFGQTRREGLELGAAADLGKFSLRADYTYVKATYRSPACLLAENNTTRGQSAQCAGDEILVLPGDRIPGIPLHNFKFGVDWHISGQLDLSADLVAFSSQYLRGNENNDHRSGAGSGTTAGYGVVNLAARYRVDKDWALTGRIGNLFDKHYASAGALAQNPFDARGRFQTNSGNWASERFTAPGAPRSIFVALSLDLD